MRDSGVRPPLSSGPYVGRQAVITDMHDSTIDQMVIWFNCARRCRQHDSTKKWDRQTRKHGVRIPFVSGIDIDVVEPNCRRYNTADYISGMWIPSPWNSQETQPEDACDHNLASQGQL